MCHRDLLFLNIVQYEAQLVTVRLMDFNVCKRELDRRSMSQREETNILSRTSPSGTEGEEGRLTRGTAFPPHPSSNHLLPIDN